LPQDAPFSPEIIINDDIAGNQNEVSMASDKKGNLVAGWNDDGDGAYKCGFASSHDGGKTWSKTERYAPPGKKWGGDPVVVSDIDGNFYRLCMGFDADLPWYLGFSKSTDGGRTWSAWSTVEGYDKPWLAAYKGKLYITYMSTTEAHIELLRSYDDGKTWLEPIVLGEQQGSCIVTDAKGNLYASWGLYYIEFRKSTTSGDRWTPAITLGKGSMTHGHPRSASLTGCTVTPDGRDVYVVWSGNGSVDDLYVAASHNGGDSWDPPVRVNEVSGYNNRSILPGITVDPGGVVHVIWVSNIHGGWMAYYSNSTDGGKTWSKNIRVSTAGGSGRAFIGDYNSVTVTPAGEVAVAWCDDRNGYAGDIFFSSAPIANMGVLTRIEITPSNPTITADQTLRFTAKGYDQNNRLMLINPTWSTNGGSIDANGLYTPDKAGVYRVTASQRNVTGSTHITVKPGAPVKLEVTPKNATITADETQQFNASMVDAKGNPIEVIPVWSTTGGMISPTGLYVPEKTGTYKVTATAGSFSDSALITVKPGKPVAINVEPSRVKITTDDTVKFNAIVTDAKGNTVPVNVNWTTNGGSIDNNGVYTPDKVGVYIVTAKSGTLSATAEVTVKHGKLAKIMIDPLNATVEAGKSVIFTIRNATDAKGNEIPISELTVKWSTSNTTIGTITQAGEFLAISPGTTSVTASVTDGKAWVNVSASVTVLERPSEFPWWWILLLIILIMVAIIVAIASRKKKKKHRGR
jgi:hypothetical protein